MRTLEYHVQRGAVAAQKIKGRRGYVADFAPAEIERFRAHLLASRAASPAIVQADTDEGTKDAQTSHVNRTAALATKDAQTSHANLAVLAEVWREALGVSGDGVRTSEKLLLTLPEAARLAGLSVNYLRGAIGRGELAARKIGRGWKVKRSELEKFIEGL